MIKKTSHARVNYLSRLMVLPIACIIFIGISCTGNSDNTVSPNDSSMTSPASADAARDKAGNGISEKRIASVQVQTSGKTPMVEIAYADGTTETISFDEAQARGLSIPPPPPPTSIAPFDESKDDANVASRVDKEATFPGGKPAWQKYITNAIRASIDSFTEKDFGTCSIRFVVEKDGTVRNVQALNMQDSHLARISVEAIRKGPKWNPAMLNGQYVAAYTIQPVTLKNPYQ